MTPDPGLHLRLAGTHDAVPRARRFLLDVLREWGLTDLAGDTTIVGSELVTNAVLHAGTDVIVSIARRGQAVRIDVTDENPDDDVHLFRLPAARPSLLNDGQESAALQALLNEEATTGRGLMLVAACASAWGVRRTAAGKAVWAIIGDADPAVASSPEETSPMRVASPTMGARPARLIAIPVRLALASDVHLDAILREVQVAGGSSVPGDLQAATSELAASVEAVLQAVHLEARAAASRGDRLFDMNLLLSAAGLQESRRFLEVLEWFDEQCRAGRLLAFPASEEVSSFRRWPVEEVARQLTGQRPRPCPYVASPGTATGTLEHALKDRHRAAEVARLSAVLAGAASRGELLRSLVSESVSALGATRASVCLLDADGETVRIVESIGYPEDVRAYWQAFSVSADLPANETIRSGQPVVCRTPAERDERYPAFVGTSVLDDAAFVTVPLPPARPPARAALVVNFAAARDFSASDLAVLGQIAQVAGDALDRFAAAENQAELKMLSALGDAAATLFSNATDRVAAFRDLARLLVPQLADSCSIHIPDGDALRLVALVHRDLDKAELAVELHRRYPPKVGEPSIGRTYSTGRTDVLPVIPEDLLPALAADLQHLELLQRLALSSAATVAVANDDRVFAVIAIANGHGRYVTDSDVSALERVAARLATELANAGTQ